MNKITCTRTSTYILFCDKTRVHMFYFDYKTARPNITQEHRLSNKLLTWEISPREKYDLLFP